MPGTFSPSQRVSYSDMHHGTCVKHVSWCMWESLTSDFLCSRWQGKRPGIPCAYATRNFAYLIRGPLANTFSSPWLMGDVKREIRHLQDTDMLLFSVSWYKMKYHRYIDQFTIIRAHFNKFLTNLQVRPDVIRERTGNILGYTRSPFGRSIFFVFAEWGIRLCLQWSKSCNNSSSHFLNDILIYGLQH